MRKVAEAQAGGQFIFSAGGGSAKLQRKRVNNQTVLRWLRRSDGRSG